MHDLFEYFDSLESIDSKAVAEMKICIRKQKVVVIRGVWDEVFINNLLKHLADIGRHSMPNYQPITPDAPNFHRLNKVDPRAYVKGCFQQFNFFPWNQDYFDLFMKSEKIFNLKNELSDLPQHAFHTIGHESLSSYTARVAFQFYPAGQGFLNKHSDPVGDHQFALPNMILSQKGVDFQSGGTFIEKAGVPIYHEDYCSKGDIVMFDASIPHGVDMIDEEQIQNPWLNYKGRWMALFSVNKYAGDTSVSDSSEIT